MASPLGAYIEIPRTGAKLLLHPGIKEYPIGKKEIKEASINKLPDPNAFNSISSIRFDALGNRIKEHFIIKQEEDAYFIEDLHSTNGTYLNSINLKTAGKQRLKDGDKIIIPIEENGKLMSLELIFHNAKKPEDLYDGYNVITHVFEGKFKQYSSPGQYHTPQYKTPSSSSAPKYSPPSYDDEEEDEDSGQAYYADPSVLTKQRAGPTAPAGVNAYKIPSSSASSSSSSSIDIDFDETSQSFFVVSQKVSIPPNAFRPDSGIDLSMVYKLEKSELWHISVAILLLFTMVYHTYLNIMIILWLFKVQEFDWQLWFLTPLPLSIIFAISFVTHELSHLYTGKHYGYQSRFCLTKVGFKQTLRSALIGIPFGLPGAAISIGVDPDKDIKQVGWIKTAGPLSNLILGTIFLIASIFIPVEYGSIKMGIAQGATLNYVLGVFNLLPIQIAGFALDGKNIITFNKPLYITMFTLFIAGYIWASILITQFNMEITQYYYNQYLSTLQ